MIFGICLKFHIVYEGFFENDIFSGKGCLKYKGGKKGIYEGMFKENLRHGKGYLKDDKGNIFEGTFYKGKKDLGKEIFINGDIYEGPY